MDVLVDVACDPLEDDRACWSATSPAMPRWFAFANSLDELQELCVEALDVVLGRPDATIEYRLPGDPSAAA